MCQGTEVSEDQSDHTPVQINLSYNNCKSSVYVCQLCHLGWWVRWAGGNFLMVGGDASAGWGKFVFGRGNQTTQCRPNV